MNGDRADQRYVVLVDVVGSRDIEDRASFERRLETALADVNDAESDCIATPFTRMKGIDAFGGVLTDVAAAPDAFAGVLDRIHPTGARFAVATGGIDVGTDSETVAEMDGPAFHRASTLLDDVEERDLYVGVDTGRATDGLVASALNLLLLEREDVTERQMEVILAYERHGTQTAAAEALGLRQQGVSNALRRANYGRRSEIRRTLRQALESIYE
jgi:hypothetical protein